MVSLISESIKHDLKYTHTQTHNTWTKLWMCFYVLLWGKLHLLLLSCFSVFPQPACEPISLLQSVFSVIHQSRHPSDQVHTLTTCTRRHTNTVRVIAVCPRWERDVGDVGLYFRAYERGFFIVNLFPSHIKSCRTYSSTQCSLCLTTRVCFWDVLV